MESSSSRLLWPVYLMVVYALIVQFQIGMCNGCLEQERTALLQIKASMSDYQSPPDFHLPESWNSGYEGGGSSDCCGWEGVECNITTAKVIKLVLLTASFAWPLDASMFLPFGDLTHLDLSYNYIYTLIPNQGFGRLSVLPKLHSLILEGNAFNETILPSLAELSSLRTLSLRENYFEGTFDFGELHNMTNLYELDLEHNSINAIKGLGRLHTLDRLEVLQLGGNNLDNSIIPSIRSKSTLKALSLRGNQFNGSFDVRGLERFSKLSALYLRGLNLNHNSSSVMRSLGALSSLGANGSFGFSNLLELDLSLNDLYGMIPSWLGNFTSLQFLDLSGNHFEGNLALSPVTDLSALECLFISDNNLEIPFSLTSFFNHSKLKLLEADNNKILLSDSVEEFHVPKFQLQLLSFTNCWSNNPITRFPNFFRYQSDLRILHLSQINLAVPFPTWLLENNTLLKRCTMRNNSLTGSFLFPSHFIFPQTTFINIADNHLASQILENIGQMFPKLIGLDMSGNRFGGHVPTSIGKLKYLETLDLSRNYLSGEIPTMDCPSLHVLKLSQNNLSGQLSPSLYNLHDLEYLYLDDNNLVGEIPDISQAFSLEEINLSNNHFSGKLPRWIGNMTSLSSFSIGSNHLEGSIPIEFCKLESFRFLDLSNNELSGSIPSCFNPPYIMYVHLSRNKLSGPMTRAFQNSSSLITLDLLDNNLTGGIPRWIGNLSSLSVLLLKLNNFDGKIPQQLCNLESLSLLDLSQNHLSGRIPLCLSSMPFLTSSSKSGGGITVSGSGFVRVGGFIYDKEYPKRLRKNVVTSEFPGAMYESAPFKQEVEFSTKYGSHLYRGTVLDLMSGIDLSCNQLTGEIPAGLGNLSNIHTMNLSHNHLTGPIPTTFSSLTSIESLDLSYNNLSGAIPQQLVELHSLGSFTVAHNNLSGPLPDRKAQFGTFDEKSYEGNPQLCGPPLLDSCSIGTVKEPTKPQGPEQEVKPGDGDDMVDFYASCVATYVTVLIIIAAIFVINPRWRRAWFDSIEGWMTSHTILCWTPSKREW